MITMNMLYLRQYSTLFSGCLDFRAAVARLSRRHLACALSAIIGLVLVPGFSICEATAQTSTNSPVRLKPAMFIDYEFTLISDKDYLYYFFMDNGSVDETFGNKGKNSPAIALGEGWRIEHGNTLVFLGVSDAIGAVPNPVRHTLQFKSFGEKIVVTTDGQRFRRSKLKRPD
ncbi:MAG TPA: hypothetical protein VN048_04265 [Verrucomicrobiae bacterium]|nr:hypothetical protein [Verrucomicrobiae bacterium]